MVSKKHEHSHEALEEKHRLLVQSMNDQIFSLSSDGTFRFVNEAYARPLNLTPADFVGKTPKDLLPPAAAEAQLAFLRQVFASGNTGFSDFQFVTSTGEIRHAHSSLEPFHDDQGQPLWALGIVRDVTDSKRAEEARQENSRRLELALRSGGLAVWDWNLQTHTMVWDDAMLKLYGLAREQFLGTLEAWTQGLHPEDRERALAESQAALDGIRDFNTEFRVLQSSGRVRHIKASALVVRDESGAAIRMLGLNQDVTEQRQSEEKYQTLFREMLDAFALHEILCDAENRPVNYRFLAVNPAFERMVGLTAETVVGKTVLELWPDIEAYWIETYGKVALTGEPVVFENLSAALGKVFAVRAFRPTKGQFACIFADITAHKQAEEELEQSHSLLTNLARLVPSAIYQYRLYPDGRSAFPYSSPGINDIYEVTPEEVREDGTPVFGRLHPEDSARVNNAIMESARTLQVFYSEFRVILPRQGLRWRWSQAHPERTEDGGTLWHGIISDITERKHAEAEKAKLEAQLQQAQKMESVGRLAGGVAHDFNNMLGVILGHVELAAEQMNPTHPIHTDLLEIQKAARRSADLTRQLLAFARKQTVAPRVLDLNRTVEGMLKMLHRLIGEDIELTWNPAVALWPVNMDPSQIDQILANLCVNARDAIGGVGKMTIETGNRTFDQDYCASHAGYIEGAYVQIVVSDNGSGMDREMLAHLFEPFFTTKAVGKGTGLGLATVYGIVKQNNGFINVYSEPGQGTTFKVYLPRHGSGPKQEVESAATIEATGGHEIILLVEDEPSILQMTKMMLERRGYTVLATSTPGEAIRIAREHPAEIHMLITDVVMPEMNGRDLARNLLSLYPSMKRLFMSGYTADVIAHHGVLDKGVNFIQKPFSGKDLAAKVREALAS
jgi:PAS domain S-box-containing protein